MNRWSQQPQNSIATSEQQLEVLANVSNTNNRANKQQSTQKSKAGRTLMPRDANDVIIRSESSESGRVKKFYAKFYFTVASIDIFECVIFIPMVTTFLLLNSVFHFIVL